MTARVVGIRGVRTRHNGLENVTYIMFLMKPIEGDPISDGHETTEVRSFAAGELGATDATELSRSMGRKALAGALEWLMYANDVDWKRSVRDRKTRRLLRSSRRVTVAS